MPCPVPLLSSSSGLPVHRVLCWGCSETQLQQGPVGSRNQRGPAPSLQHGTQRGIQEALKGPTQPFEEPVPSGFLLGAL